jgi:NAD(P)-dependent dehydrogenase (short-subunit alcohol dehydrogenase family)
VTDDASVAAAAETVGELDVLVNNAGISGGRIAPSDATADDMIRVYETNVFGPVRVLHAFIPLLENSPGPWSSTSRVESALSGSPLTPRTP